MKVGILTFHRAHNYGAVLQAYALSAYLKQTGCDVEIVDYRPKSIENAHGVLPVVRFSKGSLPRRVINFIRILPFLPFRWKRAQVFKQFIMSLPLSKTVYSERNSEVHGYSTLLCGSDQVWNPKITGGFDAFYTGKVKSDGAFVSYAASSEILPEQPDIEKYRDVLRRFKHVGVRESIFAGQLSSLDEKPVTQVLDPVFLLDKEQWLDFSVRPFKEPRYVLVYQVRRNANVLRYAHEYAARFGCVVKEITAEAEFMPKDGRYTTLSPQEFVGAFAHAECVITTSFHGTAFASIFRKPLKTMVFGSAGDYRALDLMDTIGITHATIRPDSVIADYHPSVYADEKRTAMILQSRKFLEQYVK